MKLSPLLLLGIIGLNAVVGIGQNQTVLDNVNGKLIRYVETKSPEKTYIHTDKAIYFSGETIWYKAYLVDGIYHSVSDNSKVVYVELVNSKDSVLVKQTLFIESIGAAGNIELPETIVDGNYTLRAYSKYMLNEKEPLIFSKQLTIFQYKNSITTPALSRADQEELSELKLQKDLIIDFYPEGGTLVYGIENTLGIKITDTDGNEISTNGKIIDQHNTTINNFETHEFGLGKVSYLPEQGKTYYASIIVKGQQKKYSLPVPKDKGYVLNLVNSLDQITLKISSNIENGLKGSSLVGHIRGRIFLKYSKDSNDSTYLVRFPIAGIPNGVVHFTLFNSKGEPLCERLTYVNNFENDNLLKILTSSKSYKKRQEINLEISLENGNNEQIEGFFSLSTASSNLGKNSSQNIESWLLLNSDVGGTIDNAAFFFNEDTPKRRYLLDALMLTHGWRRFVWKELLAENVSEPMSFEPEKGIMIEGNTTSFTNEYQPKPSIVSLRILDSDLYYKRKLTEANGKFSFGPFFFEETIRAVVQTEPKNQSSNISENEFAIQINQKELVIRNQTKFESDDFNTKNSQEYFKIKSKQKEVSDFSADPKTIKLNEVIVGAKQKTSKQILNEKIRKITRHGQPDARIFADSIQGSSALTVFDLIGNRSGVQVSGIRGSQTVSIRGGGSPLILLNGMPVNVDFINTISPTEVEFIDILKNVATSSVYPNSGGGVIAIYTKGLLGAVIDKQEPSANFKIINVNGFYKVREFYSPKYNLPNKEHNLQDLRTTLYWQPNVIIKGKNVSDIKFYSGDIPGKYNIIVEGITTDGVPVSAIQSFEVVE